jgi:hypothetical protein
MADIPPSDVTTLFSAEAAGSTRQNNALQNNDRQDSEIQGLQHQLAELESEHRDLDEVISRLSDGTPTNQLQIQRLKKRKLNLKDEITRLHAKMLPDIIA